MSTIRVSGGAEGRAMDPLEPGHGRSSGPACPLPPPGSYRTIPLTRGMCAIVDPEDYAKLAAHKWCALQTLASGGFTGYYAYRRLSTAAGRKGIYMHRLILGLEPGDPRQADHRWGSTLDNRKGASLRIATPGENARNRRISSRNTSGHPGVYRAGNGKWRAQITLPGAPGHHLYFGASLAEACAVYDKAAKQFFGEFWRGCDLCKSC